MSRSYRIDFELHLAVSPLTRQDTWEYIRKEVLVFLIYPELNPRNKRHFLDIRAMQKDLLPDAECDIISCHGTELMRITGEHIRNFTAGYSEENFKNDLLMQIDRFIADLPWKFSASITATCLDIDPNVIVTGGDLDV